MPKAQEHTKMNILRAARPLVLGEGGGSLTLRAVAERCHIAVGTIYNYFPSKEQLLAEIILEDWLITLSKIQRACGEAASLGAALSACAGHLQSFARLYAPLWGSYRDKGMVTTALPQWHGLLVEQLAKALLPPCSKEQRFLTDKERLFLGENLLRCALGSTYSVDDFIEIINKNL